MRILTSYKKDMGIKQQVPCSRNNNCCDMVDNAHSVPAHVHEPAHEPARNGWTGLRARYIAHADGSTDIYNQHGPSGAAYVILDAEGKVLHRASKGYLGRTGNFVGMMAIISAVNWVPDGSEVTVFSDSQYAVNVLSGKWNARANLELGERFNQASKGKRVSLKWVSSRVGDFWNGVCEKMARAECDALSDGLQERRGHAEIV